MTENLDHKPQSLKYPVQMRAVKIMKSNHQCGMIVSYSNSGIPGVPMLPNLIFIYNTQKIKSL